MDMLKKEDKEVISTYIECKEPYRRRKEERHTTKNIWSAPHIVIPVCLIFFFSLFFNKLTE
jgi:hypothetical protein